MFFFSPARRVQRVRHELRRREVTVVRVEPLGDAFVAVTFGGESLDGFVSLSFDDHVKFMFDGDGGEPVRRDYTPRRFDAARRELTIEFALHGHGLASAWARAARPGAPAVIGGPRGSMIVPLDHDWHLLAGDATALPAIRRRLQELPAGARAIVIAEAASDGARLPLETAATLQATWVRGPQAWLEALGAWPRPAGDGFAWCAGEARVMAQARTLLLHKGQPRAAMRVAAYWKQGASAFHENLEA